MVRVFWPLIKPSIDGPSESLVALSGQVLGDGIERVRGHVLISGIGAAHDKPGGLARPVGTWDLSSRTDAVSRSGSKGSSCGQTLGSLHAGGQLTVMSRHGAHAAPHTMEVDGLSSESPIQVFCYWPPDWHRPGGCCAPSTACAPSSLTHSLAQLSSILSGCHADSYSTSPRGAAAVAAAPVASPHVLAATPTPAAVRTAAVRTAASGSSSVGSISVGSGAPAAQRVTHMHAGPACSTWHMLHQLACSWSSVRGCSPTPATPTAPATHPNVILNQHAPSLPRNCLAASLLLQHLAGVVIAVLLVMHRQAVAEWLAASGDAAIRVYFQSVEWVMTARPAGVKLHAESCALLGGLFAFLLSSWWWLFSTAAVHVWGPASVWILAGACATGGMSMGLAACRDLLLLATLPTAVLHMGASLLLQMQWRCLRVTWGMMRGTRTHKPRAALQLWLSQVAAARRAARAQPASSPDSHPMMPHQPSARDASPVAHPLRANDGGGYSNKRSSSSSSGKGDQGTGVASPATAKAPSDAHAGQMQGRTSSRSTHLGSKPAPHPHSHPHRPDHPRQKPTHGQRRLLEDEALWGAPTQREEVVVEQLIVGVLLFVPLAALLPTTLAWVALATAAHVAAVAVRGALLWEAQASILNLAVLCLWRALRPSAFPGAFTCEPLVAVTTAPPHTATQHTQAAVERKSKSHSTRVGGCSQGAAGPVRVLALQPWSVIRHTVNPRPIAGAAGSGSSTPSSAPGSTSGSTPEGTGSKRRPSAGSTTQLAAAAAAPVAGGVGMRPAEPGHAGADGMRPAAGLKRLACSFYLIDVTPMGWNELLGFWWGHTSSRALEMAGLLSNSVDRNSTVGEAGEQGARGVGGGEGSRVFLGVSNPGAVATWESVVQVLAGLTLRLVQGRALPWGL